MPRQAELRRRIAVRMGLVTLLGLSIAALCAFFIYSWVFTNHPDAVPPPHQWVPQPIDYLVITAAILVAVTISVGAGVELARRIVLPLVSLAEAARRVTSGDLTARAAVADGSLSETATLVDDFNRMVAAQEALANRLVNWNAAIAHELRTPLTILRGRLQGVADDVFQMDGPTLTSLLRQVDGLTRLVEDLRVVSLADSGRLDLRAEPVDLAEVVGELREAVEPELAAEGFSTEWRLEPVVLTCDPTRLRQAVLALIENARRHATPGPLVIWTGRTEAVAFVAVEDAGPGVSAELGQTIFEPFRRNPARTTGSGLGLSVVRAIADVHHGRAFHVPSPLGGSTFTIEIPRVPTEA